MITEKHIEVGDAIKAVCPDFVGVAVYAQFTNTSYSDVLWQEIDCAIKKLCATHTIDDIKTISGIMATRSAYRSLGKDPSRYRPSNEALMRRILQNKGLYQINTAVDLVNLCSIEYGYSIGGFDYDRIVGDDICLGVGQSDEPYEGIGRGALNIEHMPVYRDEIGGIGTPTSDNERTKLDMQSTHMLAIINGYDGNGAYAMACAQRMVSLLSKYASCSWSNIRKF